MTQAATYTIRSHAFVSQDGVHRERTTYIWRNQDGQCIRGHAAATLTRAHLKATGLQRNTFGEVFA